MQNEMMDRLAAIRADAEATLKAVPIVESDHCIRLLGITMNPHRRQGYTPLMRYNYKYYRTDVLEAIRVQLKGVWADLMKKLGPEVDHQFMEMLVTRYRNVMNHLNLDVMFRNRHDANQKFDADFTHFANILEAIYHHE